MTVIFRSSSTLTKRLVSNSRATLSIVVLGARRSPQFVIFNRQSCTPSRSTRVRCLAAHPRTHVNQPVNHFQTRPAAAAAAMSIQICDETPFPSYHRSLWRDVGRSSGARQTKCEYVKLLLHYCKVKSPTKRRTGDYPPHQRETKSKRWEYLHIHMSKIPPSIARIQTPETSNNSTTHDHNNISILSLTKSPHRSTRIHTSLKIKPVCPFARRRAHVPRENRMRKIRGIGDGSEGQTEQTWWRSR